MLTFLLIGAHPDDVDLDSGGLALKLISKGHHVYFLSMTNGNAGHMTENRDTLRTRRLGEMQEAARRFHCIRYDTMDIDDGYLKTDHETRDRLIRYIRQLAPDVIVTHRSCDYHPDHRACGQLVQDCSYLIGVPLICPDTPALRYAPVIMFSEDCFTSPSPFRADLAVGIDAFVDAKVHASLAHVSQLYEWLPYDGHWDDVEDAATEKEKTEALTLRLKTRCQGPVQRFPSRFSAGTHYGEVFQVDEYGGPLTDEIRSAMED